MAKLCKWLDFGGPCYHCYLRGIQMHPDLKEPRRIKDGRTIYPFCEGKPCKELKEKGEEYFLRERQKEYDRLIHGK